MSFPPSPPKKYVRVAEGAFLRMVGRGGGRGASSVPGMLDPDQAISSIDYVENAQLERQFDKAKEKLKLAGGWAVLPRLAYT